MPTIKYKTSEGTIINLGIGPKGDKGDPGPSVINDTLTSTDPNQALSANMGVKLNNIKTEYTLLWKNPDIKASFPPQTLPIDLSRYPYYYVEYTATNSGTSIATTGIITKGMTSVFMTSLIDSSSLHCRARICYSENNTLRIANCAKLVLAATVNTETIDNLSCVPYKVYGVQIDENVEKYRGFLNLKTNTSPSPITSCSIYKANSNGTPSFANYTNLNNNTSFATVDYDNNNLPTGIHKDYVCMGYMCEVKWSIGIKIHKVRVVFQDNVKANDTSYCKVVGLKLDGSEVALGTYSLVFPTQNDYLTQVAVVPSFDTDTSFYGIRAYIYNSNPTAGRAMYIKDMDIIEWS